MTLIDEIREILFIKADEFKTEDTTALDKINKEIEYSIIASEFELGQPKFKLAIALLTAHNLTLKKYAVSGYSGSIISEEIDDQKIVYSQNGSKGMYSETTYGKQYEALISLKPRTRTFFGTVI